MKRMNKQLPYQRLLASKRIALPLTLVLGFAGGLLSAGYVGVKSRCEIVPAEIVVTPPPPNATWCFPNIAFTIAERFSKELAKQLSTAHAIRYSDTMLTKSIKAVIQRNKLASEDYYQLHLLATTPHRFAVISAPRWDTDPGNYTLVTEQGYFYLHAIPKRRHEKYDSLASARLGYRN